MAETSKKINRGMAPTQRGGWLKDERTGVGDSDNGFIGRDSGADGVALMAPAGDIGCWLFSAGKTGERITNQRRKFERLAGSTGKQAQLGGEAIQDEIHIARHGIRAHHRFHPLLHAVQLVKQEGVQELQEAGRSFGAHGVRFSDAELLGETSRSRL